MAIRIAAIGKDTKMNSRSNTTKDQPVIATARSVKQPLRVLKALLVCICLFSGIAGAQSLGAYTYFARAGWVCGAGASNSSVATKPTVQCGGMFSGPFFDLEAGVMGPSGESEHCIGLPEHQFIHSIDLPERFGQSAWRTAPRGWLHQHVSNRQRPGLWTGLRPSRRQIPFHSI